MSIDHTLFFADLVDHFQARRDAVRSLAVMLALERWVQMEAAALLDLGRDRYGIGGGTPTDPDWWVTCEYERVDLWAEGPKDALAIELKAIHNNKNFYVKVAELRNDLTPELKSVPTHIGNVSRLGIVVLVYAVYEHKGARDFVPLRSSRGGPLIRREEFLNELKVSIEDDDPWYGESSRLRLLDLKEITALEGARYVLPGQGSAFWLGLVEAIA